MQHVPALGLHVNHKQSLPTKVQESFVQPAYTMMLIMCEPGKSRLHISSLSAIAPKQLMCLALHSSPAILPVLHRTHFKTFVCLH